MENTILEKAYKQTISQIEWQIESAQKTQEAMMQKMSTETFEQFFRWNANDLLKSSHNVSYWSEVLDHIEDNRFECAENLQALISNLIEKFEMASFRFNSTSILTNAAQMFIAEADGNNLKILRALHKRQIAAEA